MLRRQGMGLLLVVLVAVVVRLVYLMQIRESPFFLAPVIDADFYNNLAQSLAGGEGTGRAPFMMPPLYPLTLSALYQMVGVDLSAAHLLQFFFGTLTAVLTWFLGTRLVSPQVGLLAGLLVATNRSLLYIEGDLLATPLATLLDVAFLVAVVLVRQTGRWPWIVAAGLLLGLAALTRPPVLVVLPVFAVWWWLEKRRAAAGVLVVLTLGTLLPVSLHNQRASGEWVWISANGGINFWIGNNADMRHTVALRPGPEWRQMNDLPLREDGRVTPVQRDRWFYQAGLREIVRDPLAAAQRTGEKTLRLLTNHEIMRDFDFYFFRQHYAPLLWMPTGNWALLLCLALVAAFLARPRPPDIAVLWCFLLPYALSIVAFFATARYRAPLIPALCVLGAWALLWCVQQLRQRHWAHLGKAVALVLLGLLISLPDWTSAGAGDAVEARYRIAKAQENAGDLRTALQGYQHVLQLDPDHAVAGARAAGVLQRLGQVQEAVHRYEDVLQRHPEYVEVMVNLANVAWRFGDAATARGYFDLAQRTDPWYAQAFGYHGMFEASQSQHDVALSLYDRALQLDPAWEQLRIEQARSWIAAGQAARAVGVLQAVPVELQRGNPVWSEVMGDALAASGRFDEARRLWQQALQLDPANARLRDKVMRGAQP